jgi:hypothetical protein
MCYDEIVFENQFVVSAVEILIDDDGPQKLNEKNPEQDKQLKIRFQDQS